MNKYKRLSLLFIGLVIFSGCQNKLQDGTTSSKSESSDSEEVLSINDSEYMDKLAQSFKDNDLIEKVNKNFVPVENIENVNTYDTAVEIIELIIQPETNTEAINEMRTGKILLFENNADADKFINIMSKFQNIDNIGIDTNESSPILISSKKRPIVLQLSMSLTPTKIDHLKDVFENSD